jgi:uncharacterized membrane protein
MKHLSLTRRILATAALALVAGTVAYAQPKLEIVGGDTHDWGTVAPGKLTAAVQVKNTGNVDLKITDVHPGCGCTAAPIDKNLLKPGEIGTINITLDVTSRTGPTEKIVTITSNDSTNVSRVLHLKADVHRAVTVTPMQYMLVNNANLGAEAAATAITIKNTSDAAFTVQAPKLSADANFAARFDMKGSKELKPGEQFELKTFVTPKDAQSIIGTISLKTSSTETPSIDIPVSGTMARPATTSTQAPGTSQPAGAQHH